MSSSSRRRAVACAVFAAVIAGGVLVAETLTLEDVVRLHVSGLGDDALIARIRAADVDFDLSEAMLGELRAAGLSEPVIAAMIERQNALHPPPPPAPPAPEEEDATQGATLVLHMHSGVAGAKPAPLELRVATAAPTDRARPEGAGQDASSTIDDAALWVACVTATHVPDQWRMESPLGRDFDAAPRHRMLHFLSGAKGDGASGAGGRTLRLAIPETIELALDPGETHQLVIGVAVRLGGRWLATSASSAYALETGSGTEQLAVSLVQRGANPGAVRLTIEPVISDPARAR